MTSFCVKVDGTNVMFPGKERRMDPPEELRHGGDHGLTVGRGWSPVSGSLFDNKDVAQATVVVLLKDASAYLKEWLTKLTAAQRSPDALNVQLGTFWFLVVKWG